MSDSPPMAAADGPLAIICGAGRFPYAVAEAVAQQGRQVVLFALQGWADAEAVARFRHHWTRLDQPGRFQRLARAEGCRDVVLIGSLVRPSISQLRPDLTGLRLLPRVIRLFRGGDDHLLSGIGGLLEELGFRLIGVHEVFPEILVPEGTLGRHQPSERDRRDIDRGFALLDANGPFDIGQAAVMAHNRVLAVEGPEGTDAMLARVADMRREGRVRMPPRTGVLVKAPKPSQDRRLDLPAIGRRTVEEAFAAGLAGIAVEAKGTISSDLQEMIAAADAAGLFLVGVRGHQP